MENIEDIENVKNNGALTPRDRQLLEAAQQGLEITPRPFAALARKLDMEENEVISRLKSLRESGYIRRLGGIFSSRRLGWESILLAARVPRDDFAGVRDIINSHPGVSHNYRRNHDYNMWFTLSVPPEQDLQAEIEKLEERTGLDFLQLPRLKRYKLGVKMKMKDGSGFE